LKLSARLILGLTLICTTCAVQARAADTPEHTPPNRFQDSVHLTRNTSAVMPADGLLSVAVGARKYSTVHTLDGFLERLEQMDAFLRLEAGPVPWLQLSAELPWRSWSQGKDWIPETGSGLADGHWQLTSGGNLGGGLYMGLFGGGNLPLGKRDDGLGEGVFSPRLGAALTWRFWTDNQVPEMRLHFNLARRWNKAEDLGYGVDQTGLQPWPPRYPAAATVGGPQKNDQWEMGLGVEFRKGTTSMWVEYAWDRFPATDLISPREQYSGLTAGGRWGVMEGWALHLSYLVSLVKDDATTAWDPAYPEMVMSLAASRQFGIGGRDRDGDGIADRHDGCPDHPEDLDGFQDDDGCPEYDNDGDGIHDIVDLAPDSPEDFDGFEDEDGRPDWDNDMDGIPDSEDLCPNDPEDFDGHRDDDGCPDDFQDRDGDGVEDSKDGCPDDPEDRDGYEDGDGCPDTDNDLDGIPDSEDECPDDPEDYDGDDDEDGCPE